MQPDIPRKEPLRAFRCARLLPRFPLPVNGHIGSRDSCETRLWSALISWSSKQLNNRDAHLTCHRWPALLDFAPLLLLID